MTAFVYWFCRILIPGLVLGHLMALFYLKFYGNSNLVLGIMCANFGLAVETLFSALRKIPNDI